MKSFLRLLAGAWLMAVLAAPAHAIVIYDNLTATGGFNDGVGVPVDAANYQGYQWFAGASASLTDLYLGLGRVTGGGTAPLFLMLHADSGNAPGELLEGFVIDSASVPVQGSGELLHVTAPGTTSLQSGLAYWLVAATGIAYYVWDQNSTGALGLQAAPCTDPTCGPGDSGVRDGKILGALRVEGTLPGPGSAAVPEPLSLALLGLGLAGLGWSRRRPRG